MHRIKDKKKMKNHLTDLHIFFWRNGSILLSRLPNSMILFHTFILHFLMNSKHAVRQQITENKSHHFGYYNSYIATSRKNAWINFSQFYLNPILISYFSFTMISMRFPIIIMILCFLIKRILKMSANFKSLAWIFLISQ